MAICPWCKKEKSGYDTPTCDKNTTVEFPDGTSLLSVPFVPNPLISSDEWWASWRECQADFSRNFPDVPPPDTEEKARVRYEHYTRTWERCSSCNIASGGFHHPGCGIERCPRCKGQLISCPCGEPEEEE